MDLEKRTEIPNSLEEHWMPFTSNRDYKNSPRLMVKAEGVYYTDCLLYTSPSPRDKRQSRMPSSA